MSTGLSKSGPGWHRNLEAEPDAAMEHYYENALSLWTPAGSDALLVLRAMGLDDDAIREACIGAVDLTCPEAAAEGVDLRGVACPWRVGGRVVRLEIRLLDPPSSADGPIRCLIPHDHESPAVFPGPDAIEPGKPLIITEWILEALVIRRAVGDVASVVAVPPWLDDAIGFPAAAAMSRTASRFYALPSDASDAGSVWHCKPGCVVVRSPVIGDWIDAAVELGPEALRAWWLKVIDAART